MALVKKKKAEPINYTSLIAAKIQQRRLQILVHSYLYYDRNTNLISDKDWDMFAKELVELQKQYPDIASKVIYADEFKDFDGTTGCDLKYRQNQIVKIANGLLNTRSSEGD